MKTPYLPEGLQDPSTRQIVADLAEARRNAIVEAGAVNGGKQKTNFFQEMVRGKGPQVKGRGNNPAKQVAASSANPNADGGMTDAVAQRAKAFVEGAGAKQ